MITEEEMDRKNSNRTSSVPPKSAGATDSKKSENANGNRPKYTKKRELTGSRPRQDNGLVRRPTPQKSRTSTDKRPRSRGVCNDRQREEVTYDESFELGSALQKGSKKGNLNHLLNFTYAPREGHNDWSGRAGPAGFHGSRRWRMKPKYNKEQFLQANCQFVVKEGGDYVIHSVDPDKLVDWDFIEQVRVSSVELPSCPICLHPPIAAKITKCGHIYCSSCMLHYLALGEKNWRKCPICYDSIHKGHLKSVQTVCVPRYKVGDEITFQLMKKEKGSTLVLPNIYWRLRDGNPLSITDDNGWPSASLLVASAKDVQRIIIEPEMKALERQLASDPEDSEICFIESALALLKERASELQGNVAIQEKVKHMIAAMQIKEESETSNLSTCEAPLVHQHAENFVEYSDAFCDEVTPSIDETDENDAGESIDTDDNGNRSEVGDASFSPRHDSITEDSLTESKEEECVEEIDTDISLSEAEKNSLPVDEAVEYLEMPPEEESPRPDQNNPANSKFYYFYQAESGQHIYIHAVNARSLVKEYGSLEKCPEKITATVVEIESVFMTEELRRRLRNLCHLPLTCEFQVAEVELKPPVVSVQTLNFFSGELDRRRRFRQKKSRDERTHTKKIEQQEKMKQGIHPAMRIPLTSRSQFPSTSLQLSSGDSDGRVNSPSSVSTNSSPMLSPSTSLGLNVFASEFIPGGVSPATSPAWPAESNTLSFANMLKEGKALPKVWPKLNKPADGVKVVKSGQRYTDSDASDNEDKVPVPEFHSAFEDAIQQAFDNLSRNKETEASTSKLIEASGGKKKKKQKKLLFTTTMTRGK